MKKIHSRLFLHANSAAAHCVWLWQSSGKPPFMEPVPEWKIVGYGRTIGGFAVMFEKTTEPAQAPEEAMYNYDHLPKGTRIWQHGEESWVPGTKAYKRRMGK